MPSVSVINTVISGSLTNELLINTTSAEAASGFRADSSLIKVDTISSKWYTTSLFRNVLTTPSPRFIDETAWDFRPDTLSPLLDRAGRTEMQTWPFDIRNKPRPYDAGPDLGAFERQRGERRKDD